jgi:hypothetical protein
MKDHIIVISFHNIDMLGSQELLILVIAAIIATVTISRLQPPQSIEITVEQPEHHPYYGVPRAVTERPWERHIINVGQPNYRDAWKYHLSRKSDRNIHRRLP